MGIATLDELCGKTEDDLLSAPRVGTHTVREIIDELSKCGRCLKFSSSHGSLEKAAGV